MRYLLVALLLVGLFTAVGTAQYHDSKYVMGGYGSTSASYWNGIFLGDATAQSLTHLTPNQKIYTTYSIYMDADNKHVVFAPYGTTSTSYASMLRSGIYRLDPSTMAITTVLADTLQSAPGMMYGPRRLMINQDGDYVFSNYYREGTSYKYAFMKLDAGRTLSTLFSSVNLGAPSLTCYGVGKNMDTGNYLFNPYYSNYSYYAVFDVAPDGTFTTFGGGAVSSMYGWYGIYSNIEQDHDTGDIIGNYSYLYRLKKGAPNRTTVYYHGYPGGFSKSSYSCNLDLQSAAKRRAVITGYVLNSTPSTHYTAAVMYLDLDPPYGSIGVNLDPNWNGPQVTYQRYAYGCDFYRGRHIQTVKTAPGKWNLYISCPQFPNKGYAAAISSAGYRPPIPLPSGRKIHLVPDDFTILSLRNWLQPYFNPGPLVLDAGGEAKGSIDISRLPPLGGIPIWIAVAVIDAAAPDGIAYLPDTYVMRLP